VERARSRRALRVAGGVGLVLVATLSAARAPEGVRTPRPPAADRSLVRGITISCQTWGREWGTDGFGRELDRLAELGANWVAIHPYARIHGDGSLRWRAIDPADPPIWLARPIAEARRRGIGILIKPHLAYWGSPFAWRGEIDFAGAAERERFFREYGDWIVALARATREADAFAVGTELDRLVVAEEGRWRELVARVRAVTGAKLTYAANWTDYERVPFWDALDAIGVQAYFPLSEERAPDERELAAGWERVLAPLRALHERTGKPVVFTELGYDRSLAAASRPWESGRASGAEDAAAGLLQRRCLGASLTVLARESNWLRGAFLWKWFVGAPGWNDRDFALDTPEVRALLRGAWRG
jgi:hypothetical protein